MPWRRVGGVLVPLVVSLAVLAILDPSLWFRNAVPTLTDLPGHLLAPSVLADQLLPRGRLQGWSFDWFAGFPVYRFYFPLPGLMVAAGGALLGGPLALRIVSAAPLVLLPWALWGFGRLGGLDRAVTAGITIVGSSAMLMTSHFAFGGNILSVVVGEFSYSWSLLFVVLHLGFLSHPSPSRAAVLGAGATLAAAVLSHVIPVMVVALGTAPLLLVRPLRVRILAAWFLTGVLTAFWFLPMALTLAYTGSPRWLFIPGMEDFLPLELGFVLPGAALGLWSLRGSRTALVWTAVCLGALAMVVAPQGMVMRARPLPVWYLAVHVLAGAGIGQALATVRRDGLRRSGRVAVLGSGVALLWLGVLGLRSPNTDAWRMTMEGLPARPGHPALERLIARLDDLPPGRVHWETGDRLRDYGGAHAFSLLPYWTRHATLSGLLRESAPLSEFLPVVERELSREEDEPIFPRRLPTPVWSPPTAVERLRMLGVRYLITHSAETTTGVERVTGPALGRYGDLRLFDLGPVSLVEPLACWVRIDDGPDFRAHAAEWHTAWEPGSAHLVGAEPDAVPSPPACSTSTPATDVEAAVTLEPGRIRISTKGIGIPHLLRVSYFPNWRVRGGEGPFPASPWFMVVVPMEEEVTLDYARGALEWGGLGVTSLGVLALVALGLWTSRRRGFDRRGFGRGPSGQRPSTMGML